MQFLLLIPLLIPSLNGQFVNSLGPHISDSLKLKCDALPYRTAYIGTRCYFAVSKEAKLSEASALCSSIFPGSQVAPNLPNSVFNAMMLDKSRFHAAIKDSSGRSYQSSSAKQSICVIDSGYKCDEGNQSAVMQGKCVKVRDEKNDFIKAFIFCERYGMEVPSIGNELENKMIRGAVGTHPVWIRNAYYFFVREPKWHRQKYYSKFSTCSRPGVLSAGREIACNMGQSSVVDHTGYWGSDWEKNKWAAICVKVAENEFKPQKPKPRCEPLHEWKEDTGLCEWTGSKNACMQLVDLNNETVFIEITNFPTQYIGTEQHLCYFQGTRWNDVVHKVIVRRGCKYTGQGGNQNGDDPFARTELAKKHGGYGEHHIPNFFFVDGLRHYGDGLSLLRCFCDPTEANVNNHVPAPPPKKECIEHHVFNETTQQCEWKHDPKFCGELITNDGRRQMLEIPDWPTNKKYEVDHYNNETKRAENFHNTITEIVVRQHCWAMMMQHPFGQTWEWGQRYFLHLAGYGRHKILSVHNGNWKNAAEFPHYVICECMKRKLGMMFLFLILIPSLDGRFTNSLGPHISDSLKLKCDALPYRTAFISTRCYFAAPKEVKFNEASALCSTIFPGSQVVPNAQNAIFNAMMLDKSRFHTALKDSSGKSYQSSSAKQSICVIESGYKCDVGEQSSVLQGKCVKVHDEQKMFDKAFIMCDHYGMEVPSIGNELENKMIRGAIGKNPVWIRNALNYFVREPKWHREKYYSKHSTCSRHGVLWIAREIACNMGQSTVVGKYGYWELDWERKEWGIVCVKDAENEFKPQKPKPKCVALHEWNEGTGKCEWTGPKDACLQMVDYNNDTVFLGIPNYPTKQTAWEQNLCNYYGTRWNDVVSKVIVRRGCMYSGFGGNPKTFEKIVMGNNNLGYGEHNVPCFYFGDGLSEWGDGISIIKCYCDPTEANLNDHVPAPPPGKTCVEHHIFNETTQSCEWELDPKFCGELITNDGRRQMLEIPNWPSNKKYDVDHYNNETKRAENFHKTITEMIVRQHCWASLAQMPTGVSSWETGQRYNLHLTGYGRHKIFTTLNGNYDNPNHFPHQVICECLR